MEEKIKQIMSAALEVNIAEINNETNSDSIDSWDSLHHMNLVVALEEEFSVEFEEEEIIELMSFKSIQEKLKSLI